MRKKKTKKKALKKESPKKKVPKVFEGGGPVNRAFREEALRSLKTLETQQRGRPKGEKKVVSPDSQQGLREKNMKK